MALAAKAASAIRYAVRISQAEDLDSGGVILRGEGTLTLMAVRISQVEDLDSGRVILRVEGTLTPEYAQLLEGMSREVRERLGRNVIVDLAGVTFLDEASAALLRRLKQQPGIDLAGCQLYTRQMIEATI